MQSTVSFKFEKSHQVITLLQALGDFESKFKKLKIITKENIVVDIPETFKFFSPLLAKILEPQTSEQETLIVLPDISTNAVVMLHELVSSGNVIDAILSSNGYRYDVVSEIVDVAQLFDIKINPTTISFDEKECVNSDANIVQPEYCEIPTHLLKDPAEREIKVIDLIEEEGFKDEISTSENLETAVNSNEDVAFKTQLEETVEPFKNLSSYQVNEVYEAPTANDEISAVSLNRFDLKLKRVTARQLLKKIKRSCKSCDFKTKSKRKLSNHVQTEHQGVIFFCPSCSFQTKSKMYLRYHVQAEHEGVRFSCDDCDFQTKRKIYLKQHILAEHGNTRYSCASCSFQTKTMKCLKLHVRTAHEGVRYSCKYCNYHCKGRSMLTEHVKAEHKNFRYCCKSCSFQCKWRSMITQHVKAEHENVRYCCESCSFQTKYKKDLKRHRKLKHNSD